MCCPLDEYDEFNQFLCHIRRAILFNYDPLIILSFPLFCFISIFLAFVCVQPILLFYYVMCSVLVSVIAHILVVMTV